MIHYHGTPITPRAELLEMAGRHFCVSFARPDDLRACLHAGQSIMLDNGAFSLFTRGGSVEWGAYYKWLEPILAHPHWAVIPDVIGGDEAAQIELVKQWPHRRELGAPVWHMGLGLDHLRRLADEWPRLCFGSSAEFWQVGSTAWERRADAAFNALAKRGPLPWVHMLRGMSLAGERWPFASADSTNIARNAQSRGKSAERMAKRIDAVQCPTSWALRHLQEELDYA